MTAAFFGTAVVGLGIFLHYGARETDRIIRTGQRATATVTDKEIVKGYGRRVDTYRFTYTVEGQAPKNKPLRRETWESIKVGDRFVYYFDPAEPEFGFSEPEIEMSRDVGGWFLWGSFLVVPFLVVAFLLWWRRRRSGQIA